MIWNWDTGWLNFSGISDTSVSISNLPGAQPHDGHFQSFTQSYSILDWCHDSACKAVEIVKSEASRTGNFFGQCGLDLSKLEFL